MKKHSRYVTVSSFTTTQRLPIGGGRWDVASTTQDVLNVRGLPEGVAVFPTHGNGEWSPTIVWEIEREERRAGDVPLKTRRGRRSFAHGVESGAREQTCAICGTGFTRHGYLAVANREWRPCCSDECLSKQLGKLGLHVTHSHAGAAASEWADFDALATTDPEQAGARVWREDAVSTFTTNNRRKSETDDGGPVRLVRASEGGWMRAAEPAERMPRRELQSLARDWTAKDRRAVLARSEAQKLASMGAEALTDLLALLGLEHESARKERRACARAWRRAESAAERREIAAVGAAASERMAASLQQYRVVLSALDLAVTDDEAWHSFLESSELLRAQHEARAEDPAKVEELWAAYEAEDGSLDAFVALRNHLIGVGDRVGLAYLEETQQ